MASNLCYKVRKVDDFLLGKKQNEAWNTLSFVENCSCRVVRMFEEKRRSL